MLNKLIDTIIKGITTVLPTNSTKSKEEFEVLSVERWRVEPIIVRHLSFVRHIKCQVTQTTNNEAKHKAQSQSTKPKHKLMRDAMPIDANTMSMRQVVGLWYIEYTKKLKLHQIC